MNSQLDDLCLYGRRDRDRERVGFAGITSTELSERQKMRKSARKLHAPAPLAAESRMLQFQPLGPRRDREQAPLAAMPPVVPQLTQTLILGAVLAEVNLLDLYKGAHLLDDLVILLRESGFVAYDVCGFWRRPLDNALWQADFIFVPADSPLRQDKRWSR
jgi:hypothetical protein